MTGLEFFVEEESMKVFLQGVLPRIIGKRPHTIHAHRGKYDLLKKLQVRLQVLAQDVNTHIVILVDCDSDDCHTLKSKLEKIVSDAGFVTKSAAKGERFRVLNRIVIEEFEAWYFGDWDAVRLAYSAAPKTLSRRKFGNPDAIHGGTWEAFERIMRKAGFYRSGLRKIEAARRISAHFNPDNNTSKSFQVFRDGLKHMIGQE